MFLAFFWFKKVRESGFIKKYTEVVKKLPTTPLHKHVTPGVSKAE